ncbi:MULTISPECIES: RNA polymerase sigma factor ShbA [Pseudonocardia]|uniref:RNA polymerase sigma-70 factor, ECF subfamily n=1 Tax=Pseudonocardia oroxyli TaxID=366584 RepID=A0A1G7YP61_PSEOR|nr:MULTISPECIES: RNA polymerase sigma factor ShbA [Pseudonocardia]MCF7549694.1 RNA polymerase sigma factor ShbA [Pseudonocardia sp. WMMC193]SDG98332.1 RNA polymerase sigma-70 factor, ECF subfamily [Pseudonocardia oroxyli]
MGEGPEPELVARAKAGDRTSIDRVLTAVHPFALRYCRARLGHALPGVTAEDLAQQVCLAVLRALPRYEDRGRPFLAFVHRIAVREVADAYRAAARDPLLAELVPDRPDPDVGPEERALTGDDMRRVRPLLNRLTPAAREVLLLRVALGMSAEETAAVVGRSPGSVRTMQHRALATLRSGAAAMVRSAVPQY